MKDEENIWLENCTRSLEYSGLDRLLPVLREGLYHLTSAEGYAGILCSGFIEPNDGRFPNTFERSVHSYSRSRGYTSLFDFETPTLEQCVSEEPKWAEFFTQRKPSIVLIKLDRQKLVPRLIPNERAKQEVGYGHPIWMPYVEVWYPDPIPFSWAKKLVLITPTPSVRFETYSADEEGMKRLDCALEAAKESFVEEGDLDVIARLLQLDHDTDPL